MLAAAGVGAVGSLVAARHLYKMDPFQLCRCNGLNVEGGPCIGCEKKSKKTPLCPRDKFCCRGRHTKLEENEKCKKCNAGYFGYKDHNRFVTDRDSPYGVNWDYTDTASYVPTAAAPAKSRPHYRLYKTYYAARRQAASEYDSYSASFDEDFFSASENEGRIDVETMRKALRQWMSNYCKTPEGLVEEGPMRYTNRQRETLRDTLRAMTRDELIAYAQERDEKGRAVINNLDALQLELDELQSARSLAFSTPSGAETDENETSLDQRIAEVESKIDRLRVISDGSPLTQYETITEPDTGFVSSESSMLVDYGHKKVAEKAKAELIENIVERTMNSELPSIPMEMITWDEFEKVNARYRRRILQENYMKEFTAGVGTLPMDLQNQVGDLVERERAARTIQGSEFVNKQREKVAERAYSKELEKARSWSTG